MGLQCALGFLFFLNASRAEEGVAGKTERQGSRGQQGSRRGSEDGTNRVAGRRELRGREEREVWQGEKRKEWQGLRGRGRCEGQGGERRAVGRR